MSDWDVRGRDIDQRYAKFGFATLTDEEVWNLSKASIVQPGIACALFLTRVSACTAYAEDIRIWAVAAADSAVSPRYKGKWGKRTVIPVRIKNPAARLQASLDGIAIALFGPVGIPSVRERAVQYDVDREAYMRIRDAVGSEAVNQIAGYRYALEWAYGYARDRTFDSALKTANEEECVLLSREGEGFFDPPKRLINGSSKKKNVGLAENRLRIDVDDDSLTPNPGFRDRGFYDERYEARMRAESREDKSPTGTETPGEHDPRAGSQ